jgi:RHS repeat-associated protein
MSANATANGTGVALTFYASQPQLVATQTGTWYYFGGRLIKNANGYVGADRLGSIGKYYPYGQERPSATTNGTEKFTGYFRDSETGLDYADQRYESPGTGRFLTADPIFAVSRRDPGSWNRYAYVGGDPINRTDSSGLVSDGGGDGSGLSSTDLCIITSTYVDASIRTPCATGGPSFVLAAAQLLLDARYDAALRRADQVFSGTDGYVSYVEFSDDSLRQYDIAFSQDSYATLYAFGILPQIAVAGAGAGTGGVIVLAGGPISWTIVAGAVVITGVAIGFGYLISQAIQKTKADLRQFDEAVRRYEQQCGKPLSPDDRRRLHDAITGQGYGIDDIVEDAKAIFGCPKQGQ